MWALKNQTAYAAERSWTRDRDGQHQWIVAVQATFDVGVKGALSLADEQVPPPLAAEHFGEPGRSSLRAEGELGLQKPGTDLVINAHAHAPRGKPAEMVPVSIRVGSLHKVLAVHGERMYLASDLQTSAARPFTSRPIRYELAYGGSDVSSADVRDHAMDERNPVGRGVVSSRRSRKDQLAHAIEPARGEVHKVGPAGFGAIDSWWQPRRTHAGSYDAAWERNKKPYLPDDFDPRFVHCAPTDQQFGKPWHGGERIELTHLTPEGKLVLELPKLHFSFETAFGARKQEHRGHLCTVRIETEERKLHMVWHTQLFVSAPECDYLDATVVREDKT